MTSYRTLIQSALFSGLLFAAPLTVHAEPTTPTTVVAKAELEQKLLHYLSGDFSNFYALTQHPTTVGDFAPLLHQGKVLQLATGQQALLVSERFLDADPQSPARRHLYVFSDTKVPNSLVQTSYPVPEAFSIDELTQAHALNQLQRLPGCEVRWQYRFDAGKESFEGYRDPQRCFFIARNDNTENTPGKQIKIETILHASEQGLQITENLLDEMAEPLPDTDLHGTLMLNPIRFFNLQVSFLPEGADINDDSAWVAIQPDGLVHDHGQLVNLRTAKEQQLIPYQLRLLRSAKDNNQLKVSIYSLGVHQPLEAFTVNLQQGAGQVQAEPLRLKLTVIPRH